MYNLGSAGLTFFDPTFNPIVDPIRGYSQETPGEDPFLASKYASTFARAFQGQDAAGHLKAFACCKEFATESFDSGKFNLIKPQDMADTYQPSLKSCIVDGKAACVICSHKPINGKHSCGDPKLMQGLIRDQWHFNGYIVSECHSFDELDVDAKQLAADSVLAGQDLGCRDLWYLRVGDAIFRKLLNESYIDRPISNTIRTLFPLGFFDGPQNQTYGYLGAIDVCSRKHQQLAREAARQGIVLLKNEAGSLPLSRTVIRSLAIIGPNANTQYALLGTYGDNPCKYNTPLDAFEKVVDTVYHIKGCDIYCQNISNVDDIRKVVAAADATILVVGTDQTIEVIDIDRESLLLPGQQSNLITTAADASIGPVILIIVSGRGFDISFAKANKKIKSILWVGYPGEAGGDAIEDVIFGEFNPSGKLPVTWYPEDFTKKVQMEDFSMRPDFATGYPGRTYRFFTGDPVYSFGDGLSYT